MATIIDLFEPDEFVRGDTVKWRKRLTDYLPADGWTLTYSFASTTKTFADKAATDNGDGTHLVTLSASDTTGFTVGPISYVGRVSKSGEVFTVSRGVFQILPELQTGGDNREHAERVLTSLEAVIENRASSDEQSMSIGGQQLSLMTIDDLLRWRGVYRAEVAAIRKAERISRGLSGGDSVLARF